MLASRDLQLTPSPTRTSYLVLARDLQLTPGPRDLLASAGKGPPEASFCRASAELLQSFYRPYTELAKDHLNLLTPRTQDLLASADQGPPDLLASSSASGDQGPPAYSRAPGPPS